MKSCKFKIAILSGVLLLMGSCFTTKFRETEIDEKKKLYLPARQYQLVLTEGQEGQNSINKAARLIKGGHVKQAHEVLNEMLKKKENLDGARYFKGYVYLIERKYEAARYMFNLVKKNEDYLPAIDNNLGVMVLVEGGSKEEAFFYFNRALKRSPYCFPALVNRGVMYLEFGLYDRAYEDLENAMLIDPKNKEVLMAFGVAQRGSGRFSDAKNTFMKLIGQKDGLYNLGLVYYEDLKDWKNAYRSFKKYLSSNPAQERGNLAYTYLNRAKEKLSK